MVHFAVVGCGHIAHKHAEGIQAVEGAHLSAALDTNRIILDNFSNKYGVKGYESYDDMLASSEIDVVCICTPTGLHTALAIKAAKAGKHVLVEKPIALTLEDTDAIIAACRCQGVKLSVVHPNRYRPAIVELKQALDRGIFGKLSHVNATVRWNREQAYYDQAAWRGTKAMDGGVLMNQAIHNLDLLLWLFGPVKSVQAHTSTQLRDIECEDVAFALLEFENGTIGVVEAATTVYPKNYEESISVFGQKGSAVIGGPTANWIKHWTFESLPREEADLLIRQIEFDPYGVPGHQQVIADMVNAIKTGKEVAVTGEDGRNALKLVLDIYEAAERRDALTKEKIIAGLEIVNERNTTYECFNQSKTEAAPV
jgi:UDP-N-acetyl-2-amino-2-deoxyglucuronate dehydrogenase